MTPLIVLTMLIVWIIGPSILDFMGYKYKKDLDVYEAYVELLKRKKKNY